ncbi:MAG: helix-turn-helix domain containing protein [Candidatus Omnitrophica bacterium]|nr:helix-turn-helix domain containing protein [Candidatus Omnitrophota bacterium]
MENNGKDTRFPGWELFKKIQVIKVGEEQKVLLEGRLYMSWAYKDRLSPRVAIAQLYKLGLATQKELAEVFDIHVNSVYNYTSKFERDGIIGLLDQQPGPKEPWRIAPEARFMILEAAFSNTDISYEKIADLIKQKWNKEISISSIRSVLIENGFRSLPIKGQAQESPTDLFKRKGEKQLELRDFKDSGEISDPPNLAQEAEEKQIDCVKEDEINPGENFKKMGLSFYSPTERIYLNRLEKGAFSAYAGGLLFIPLLQQYNFVRTIKRVIDIKTYEGYTLGQLCLTLLYCDVFGFRSVENFKTVYPEEFGILIGRSLSPSIFTIRRFLHKVRKLKKGEQLMGEFGKEYLTSGLVKWGILYIDAHFLPYYGICVISMGWHGVRQMPMKESYNFMAIDDKFNPLIFFIRPSSEDLIKKIPELILKAKDIAKEVGIADDKLIVVFDREGYSAELFREFNDKLNATFISWAKYFDSWKPKIKEEQFDKSVVVNYEAQKSEEIKYFEAKDRIMKKYGKVWAIVIQSGRKKKQSAIYTNDWELEADLIIQLICRRWGQETLIKTLRLDHRIDYFPGYESEELEEQPMVDHPGVMKLKRTKANLAKELHKLKSGFADILLDKVSEEINWREVEEKKIKTLADIQTIKTQMSLIDLEIDKLPEKVKFDEAHKGTKLVEFDYEKKRFLDCIKIFSYTIQKKACEVLSKYYDNPKDVWQILGMIVRRGAEIKLKGNILTVKLKKFTNEVVEYAARHLCEELNEMAPITLDKFGFRLQYEVE